MELCFRTATVADAVATAALVRRAYRGPESRLGWTTEADLLDDERIDAATVTHKISGPDSLVLLAEDADGSLVACCELVLRQGGRAYFGMFAVQPTRQGGGIGRAMLDHASRLVQERWGAAEMELHVIGQRRELIAWYERRGFRITGERRPFPYGELLGGTALRDDLYFEVLVADLDAAPPASPRVSLRAS